MTTSDILQLNIGFVAVACAVLLWAQWRTRPGPAFPGPPPVGRIFKTWLVVIWLIGLVLPIQTLIIEPTTPTRLALLPYLVTFVLQVLTELLVWKRWRSPVWVLVPCLYLPWRLFQVWLGFDVTAGHDLLLTRRTLAALAVLWIVNIGVHYTNICNTLRWHAHPPGKAFPSLKDPRVFVRDAQSEPAR